VRPSFTIRPGSLLRRVDPNVWLVIAFSVFAVLPLAGPNYFFDAHDAPNSVFFLTEFDAAIRDGVWYPGWATDQALGYGYPTFVLYPPLAYYAAEVFHLLGAGTVAAIKWAWALATIGAGLAMYAYARHVLGRWRGLLAAVVYVYVPYHLVDIYVRADLAEYLAYVWMPLALLAFHQLVERVTARRIALAGLCLGGLWLAHNVTALVFTPVLAIYVIYRLLVESHSRENGEKNVGPIVIRRGSAALGGSLLGLGIAAALILPNLLERSYINQDQWVKPGYDYAQHFLHLSDLLSPAWGYAPGVPGTPGVMSYQLGAVPLLLALVAMVAVFRRPARERGLTLFFTGVTLVLVFLMMPISAPVWQAVPPAALIQFPWRLLALTAITLSILAALALPPAHHVSGITHHTSRITPPLLLSLVAVLASFAYTQPQYTPIPANADSPLFSIEFELKYTDMRGMTRWTQKLPDNSPLVAQYQAGGPLVTGEVLAPGASLEMIRAGGASDEMWVRSPEGTALRFYTYYFPGWRVYVDGRRLPDSALRPETVYGLLTVDIPPGEHRVLLRWGDTPVRLAGKILTLGCLTLALFLAILWPMVRKRIGPRRAGTG
jgi:hypothetical protein